MKKILILTLGLSSVVFATSPKVYVDMQQVLLTHSKNGTQSDFKPTAFKWTAGYVLKEFDDFSVAIESSAMLGVNNDSKSSVASSTTGTYSNASTTLDKLYNVNVKVNVPLVGDLSANAYVGVSRAKLISEALDYKSNNTWDNSISYGTGLEYNLLSDVSVHLDYMQYFKNLNAIELGLGFKF